MVSPKFVTELRRVLMVMLATAISWILLGHLNLTSAMRARGRALSIRSQRERVVVPVGI